MFVYNLYCSSSFLHSLWHISRLDFSCFNTVSFCSSNDDISFSFISFLFVLSIFALYELTGTTTGAGGAKGAGSEGAGAEGTGTEAEGTLETIT